MITVIITVRKKHLFYVGDDDDWTVCSDFIAFKNFFSAFINSYIKDTYYRRENNFFLILLMWDMETLDECVFSN